MNAFQIKDIVKHFVGQANTASVPTIFKKWFGSYNTAILFSQILYWSDRTSNADGWFYKSYKDWERELFLSEKEARTAAEKLVEMGLIETAVHKINGVPTKHYRLRNDVFEKLFVEFLENEEAAQVVDSKGADGNLPKGSMETYQRAESYSSQKLLTKKEENISVRASARSESEEPSAALTFTEIFGVVLPLHTQDILESENIIALDLWRQVLTDAKAGMTQPQLENLSYVCRKVEFALKDYRREINRIQAKGDKNNGQFKTARQISNETTISNYDFIEKFTALAEQRKPNIHGEVDEIYNLLN